MIKESVKHKIFKVVIETAIMFAVAGLIILNAQGHRPDTVNDNVQNNVDYSELTVWYNNKDYEKYLNCLADEYHKEKGIKLNIRYVSDIDYFDSINKANNHTDDTFGNPPDIYMLSSEELEEAYGYGLAAENDSLLYNENNYSKTALRAITYKGKYVAYPLAFDTAFMIYNTDYMQSAPDSISSILSYEENFNWEETPDISHVLYFNITDILHTYAFVGEYIDVGGENGDDSSISDFDNDNLLKSLSYYNSLSGRLRMNLEEDFTGLTSAFMEGKIICSIIDMKEFSQIRNMGNVREIKYNICEIPKINEELSSKNLSYTQVMVVNYMSDKEDMAKELAEYASYYRTDLIYSNTGMLPVRHIDYVDSFNETIQRQYDNSCILPKFRVTKDYYLQIQSLLNNAWRGSNIEEMIKTISETYKIRLQ